MELNEMQKEFYEFVLARVVEGKEDEAKALMQEALQTQQAGGFTKEYMTEIGMKVMSVIRFECIAEFLQYAQKMGEHFVQ
ncbi:MAG: hypothetical protein FWH03_03945 [Firmicutes bacterium]|nr:hypothetical protein [Bacillota bacterium]